MCVSEITIIGSDIGLSRGRHQAIIWTNAGMLLIWTIELNFNKILIEIRTFSFKKNPFENVFWKRRSFCLYLNVSTGNKIQ